MAWLPLIRGELLIPKMRIVAALFFEVIWSGIIPEKSPAHRIFEHGGDVCV
jgi:hypothetical protein